MGQNLGIRHLIYGDNIMPDMYEVHDVKRRLAALERQQDTLKRLIECVRHDVNQLRRDNQDALADMVARYDGDERA